MFRSVLSLFVLYLFFSIVGIGWANGILGQFKKRLGFGKLVLPASIGFVIFAGIAVWDFAYVGSRAFVWLATAAASCFGMIHPRNLQAFKTRPIQLKEFFGESENKSRLLWMIPIGLMVAVIPNVGPEGRVTVANRVGPDAVSYLINTRIIYNGERLDDVRNRIEIGNSVPMSNLTNPRKPQMYSLTSWNDQIAAGFLFDALRIAPSALIASVLILPGLKFTDLFEVSALILILSAVTGSVLLGGYVGEVFKNKSLGVLCSSVFLLCPLTLFNWQEGFWLQILAMPYLAMLAISLFDSTDHNHNRSPIQVTVAFTGITLFYPDLLIVYYPLVLGVIVLHSVRHRKIPSKQRMYFWIRGVVTSLLLTLPLATQLPRMFESRLMQSSSSGFWLPSWGSMLETLGIINPYLSDNLFDSIARSSSSMISNPTFIVSFISTALILFGVFKSLVRQDLSIDIFVVSAVGVFVTLYKVKAEGSPNYQFIKLQGYLLPVTLLLTMGAVNQVLLRYERFGTILLRIWLVMLLGAGLQFGIDYRRSAATTHYYHEAKLTLFEDVSASKAFEDYNILYAGSSVAVLGEIASAQNIHWVHRGFGGISTNFRGRETNPVALILSDAERHWNCLSFLQSDLVFKSEKAGVALVRVASSSANSLDAQSAQSVLAGYLSSRSLTAGALASGCKLEQ